VLATFGPSLYVVDGPHVSFFGFPYPTRMALAPLPTGGLWVWSPVALTPELEREVEALGPVREIVSPNKIHHLFLAEWARRWPAARLHAPPGLMRRRPDLRFAAELGDRPDPAWSEEIDQVIFHGSFALEEVVFFHRPSRTVLFGDLIQRHEPAGATGLTGLVMRLDGLVGAAGSTPREWRATFLRRRLARQAREHVLGWGPERLLIAHGTCAQQDAVRIVERALAWI